MRVRFAVRIVLLGLMLSCLPPAMAGARTQLAQWGPSYGDDQDGRHRGYENQRESKRMYRREHGWDERRIQDWRRHEKRYFGSSAVRPRANETYESFRGRAQVQCNQSWDRCARMCNTVRDAYRRAACVANCNNELFECTEAF